jgi:CDP-glucose 4,6-dehydratase
VGRFPYDVSKSCADLIALSYYHTFGLPVTITRCGNLFGGGDLNFNRLIPGTIRSALQNERPIIRSDGKYIRDYFYVKDAVEAYLDLAEVMPDSQYFGQAFNFGTETPVSVSDLVHLILKLLGKQTLEPIILDRAQQEIQKQYLDCSKAKRMLGWKPLHTMESGLLETINWYKDYLYP